MLGLSQRGRPCSVRLRRDAPRFRSKEEKQRVSSAQRRRTSANKKKSHAHAQRGFKSGKRNKFCISVFQTKAGRVCGCAQVGVCAA